MSQDTQMPGGTGRMQSASIDCFEDRVLVYPASISRRGGGVACRPIQVLRKTVDAIELAHAVLAALDVSRNEWPPPPEV